MQFKIVISLLCIMFLQSNFALTQSDPSASHGNTIVQQGLLLLGKPYVVGTLDTGDLEQLTYSSSMFDCVTFVEYVLASSYANRSESIKRDLNFEYYLKQYRYHHGEIDGYGSRIHYFSQWIEQFVKNKFGKNLTIELGGVLYRKKINYMTTNKSIYPKLTDAYAYNKILQAEKEMSAYPLMYIPSGSISEAVSGIQNGDIIAITTDIKGLDIVHTGFAFWKNNQLYLLHASSDYKKVMISREPLVDYITKNPHQNGIIVVRPVMP